MLCNSCSAQPQQPDEQTLALGSPCPRPVASGQHQESDACQPLNLLARVQARIPERIVEKAVWGMLPKGRLGRRIKLNMTVCSSRYTGRSLKAAVEAVLHVLFVWQAPVCWRTCMKWLLGDNVACSSVLCKSVTSPSAMGFGHSPSQVLTCTFEVQALHAGHQGAQASTRGSEAFRHHQQDQCCLLSDLLPSCPSGLLVACSAPWQCSGCKCHSSSMQSQSYKCTQSLCCGQRCPESSTSTQVRRSWRNQTTVDTLPRFPIVMRSANRSERVQHTQ
jgi:hypothetical protein